MTHTDKREMLQREIDHYGKKATFIYMGKPKTLFAGEDLVQDERSAGLPLLRLCGLEKMRSVRRKINKSGKLLMRLLNADVNIRVDVKDIGVIQ